MDRGTWWATVHGVSKSQTRLSDFTFKLKEEGIIENASQRRECVKEKNGWEAQRGWRWKTRGEHCRQSETAWKSSRETLRIHLPKLFEKEQKRWTEGRLGNQTHFFTQRQCRVLFIIFFNKSHKIYFNNFIFSLGLQVTLKFVLHKLSQRLWVISCSPGRAPAQLNNPQSHLGHWSQTGAAFLGEPWVQYLQLSEGCVSL